MKKKSTISVILVLALLATMFAALSTVNAVTGSAGQTVYFRYTGSDTPNCYMWKGAGGAGNENGSWPGVAMTKVEDNVYSYTLDDAYENIIFNGSFGQTDDAAYPGDGMIYDRSADAWSQYAGSTAPPVITISKKDGSSFTGDTVSVTVSVGNATQASYTIDNGSSVSFTGSTTVTMGSVFAVGGTTTLKVTASNENGTSASSVTLTKKEKSGGGSGATSPALTGKYATNPDNKVGARKTIAVDGDKSDWDSSMLIAQGVANDDPRVYCHWSMHEIPIDDYALYAAWDDNNLYLMYELANVQDVVAPQDDFPLSQGNLWIYNYPTFLYINTGNGNVTNGQTAGGTLWDTGTTFDDYADHIIAYSTNASNGPFIYTADDNGLLNADDPNLASKLPGMKIMWGNGKTLSGNLYGVNKAGTDNGRVAGDTLSESSDWVDFYELGHDSKLDMFYEISIPLSSLDISASDIENSGIGIMQVSTYGTSGMDCLPYDMSMCDNAALEYSKDPSTSNEKEDEDHITVPFARIGQLLGETPIVTTPSQSSSTETTPTSATTSNPAGYVLGDADGNGDVTVNDATRIQKYVAHIVSSSMVNMDAADVNKDGEVMVNDATLIQKKLAGWLTF